MLSNIEIDALAKRMNIPLEYIGYKDGLKHELPIKPNKSYILNMEDEDDDGNGSHWVAFQVNKNIKTKDFDVMYFDSMGQPPSEEIKKIIKKQFNKYVNYSTKNVQSIVADTCGYWVLAWLHWINNKKFSTKNIFIDTEGFLEFFDDLNHITDHSKNEFMLKQFFLAKDTNRRMVIDVAPNSNLESLKNMKVVETEIS